MTYHQHVISLTVVNLNSTRSPYALLLILPMLPSEWKAESTLCGSGHWASFLLDVLLSARHTSVLLPFICLCHGTGLCLI